MKWKLGFKLFLDDDARTPWMDAFRYPPTEKGWRVATSSKEAINLVITYGFPDEMSLDHDLGKDDDVMVFLKWLSEVFYSCKPVWKVHSMNPEGKKNIDSYMQSWIKSQGIKETVDVAEK